MTGTSNAKDLFTGFTESFGEAFGGQKPKKQKVHRGDARQQQVEQERRQDGQVTGGVIGALVGAGVGAAVAGGNNRGQGAIIGAVVGAGVGAAAGDSYAQDVNRQTREISAEQSQLRAARSEASARATYYQRAHRAAESEATGQSARLKDLQRQYAAGQASRDDLNREIERTREQQRSVQAQIQNVDADIEKTQRATGSSGGADQEIGKLRREKERLKQTEKRLMDAGDAAQRKAGD